MIMDLDHFKEINDTLGHHMGDLLLQEVATPAEARAARLRHGRPPRRRRVRRPAPARGQRPATRPRSPRTCSRTCASRSCSRACGWRSTPAIGLALHPLHGEDNETLQQRADIAMYSAKQSGRGHAIFEPELDRHSPRRLALAGGLRSAINEGQIQLYYQPKADLRTGRIMGAEALARWDHPEFGIVGPSEFVPIAEQTGLITPLTSFVLDAALAPGARVEGRRPRAVGRGQPLRPLVPGHAARGRDPAPARRAGASRPSCSSSRSPRAC